MCFIGFIVAGFSQNIYLTLVVSIVLTLGTLFVLRSIEAKKA